MTQDQKNNELLRASPLVEDIQAQRLVENGAEIEVRDSDGKTPLTLALSNNNESLTVFFIENNASLNKKKNLKDLKILGDLLFNQESVIPKEIGQIRTWLVDPNRLQLFFT